MAAQMCGTCRYWHTVDVGPGNQTCRRFPPTIVAEIFKDPPYPEPAAGVWPVTSRVEHNPNVCYLVLAVLFIHIILTI